MGVNLQSTCPHEMNVWRYSNEGEQELKAQFNIFKYEQERFP